MRMRLLACASIAWLPPATVVAQERTGPTAAPQRVPDFAPLPPVLPVPPAAPVAPLAETTATTTFSDVRVSGRALGPAPATRDWQPPTDEASGLTLTRPEAGGLDAAWVRRQFVDNRLIGTPVALDRVVALVQAINLAFVANGYLNSGALIAGDAPRDGGVIEIDLVHGRLSSPDGMAAPVMVRWGSAGANGLGPRYVEARLDAGRDVPLNVIAIERQFRLLAEDPAIATIKADLVPGQRPGEAGLALTVDPARRGDAYIGYANSRSPAIGGERAVVGGYLRNMFASGDVLSAEAGLTAGRVDVSGSYDTPFLTPGLVLSLRGAVNNASVVDRPLVPLDIRARDTSVEGGLSYQVSARPLTPQATGGWRAARSLTLGARFGHRESSTFLLGQPFSFSPGSVDGRSAVTVARLTADFIERGIARVTALSITATQGLAGTRSTVAGLATPDPGFRTVLVQLSHALRLARGGLELRLRLTGQIADGLLYSSERLSAGGANSVRGYRETLLLADSGAIGSVELAQPFSLTRNGRDANGTDWGAFSIAAFVDGAYVRNRVAPQPGLDALGSIGTSLTWAPSDAISAQVSYARALVDAVPVGSRSLQDRGFQFRITVRPFQLFR
jgi:hemolysin activation/secretion protein